MKRITRITLVLIGFCLLSFQSFAQETFPINGVKDSRDGHYAFTNATIFKSYNQKVEKATLLIKDGKVEAVGAGVTIPKDAVVIDLDGKFIYPSFIDLYSNYGLPEPKAVGEKPKQQPQSLSNKKGAYSWNEALHPEFRAFEHFEADKKKAKEYISLGFGSLLVHQMDGISRGTSTLVLLGDEKEHKLILKDNVAHHMAFRKGKSTQNYPSSLMGCIALIRQTYLDAQWYIEYGYKEEKNISLQAWNDVQNLIQIFETDDRLNAFRATKIGKEFGVNYILKGGGDEYKRIDDLKATGSAFIIPVNFPAAYDVTDPHDAELVSLADMKHWDLAPSNASALAKANIDFAFTTHGLKKKGAFLENIKKAIKNGLSEEDALKALTHTPAQLIKAGDKIGSLEKDKVANFIICSGNIFGKEGKILHNWIRGNPTILKDLDYPKLNGAYQLKVGRDNYLLHVKGKATKPEFVIQENDSTSIKVKHSVSNKLISLSFNPNKEANNVISLSGSIADKKWSGAGTLGDGQWVSWTANYIGEVPKKESEKKNLNEKKGNKEETEKLVSQVLYPFVSYGWAEQPKQETYLITNATVWTNESDGILEDADVLIKNGKIAQVGKGLSAGGATTIDGKGKHVTCGIIDEHSHIAISRGVNEGTQASSAEVSIADVVNSEDVNIYRQLAGGVTTSQLLHGSANPIGGQSAIIKMRWGYTPEQMKFENADPFIKFALGENVKQSNWGDDFRTRFPQTRMGVEQVFEDHFTQAAEYKAKKSSGKPYRKDLEMETILEIIESKRFITCHSYQQGEINMLMKVAERHNFRINTFTHILEGYKIADKMRTHGAGGSTFSDWWAYKYEVIDAIPHNGAIMHEQGVLTAFNSDDAEMARRLNQEAAKAVMYGDVSEEDAWKFVTLNPAKLLHLDNRVGSLKAGKDADVVIWSDNPLSIYAIAEMTFVDGIKFFDRKDDVEKQKQIKAERARLIQKMIAAKKNGDKTQTPMKKHKHHYHCDDIHDEMH